MTNAAPKWRGRARIGDGYALFVGTTGDNESHAHHAIQLAVATAGTFELWRPRLGHHATRAALIAIDEPHALAPCAAPVALLYIEGESAAGRALHGLAGRCAIDTLDAHAPRLRHHLEDSTDGGVVGMIMAELGLPLAVTSDPALSELIERLGAAELETMTTSALARRLGTSNSRFMHRFRALTGMPVRRYLRWRRLQLAVRGVQDGLDLTEAAHRAGFSDGAHFSRTFRDHFGVAPSVALSGLR